MAKPRAIVKRRKSVRNIRKITRTMNLIATARFQAALNRATATKPYSQKLGELVSDLTRVAENVDHPLMKSNDDVKRVAVLVLTSDRGLAGAYNSGVLRVAIQKIDSLVATGHEVDTYMVGKKGTGFFRFLRRPVHQRLPISNDSVRFDQVEPVANGLMDRFAKGEISAVYVVFMQFESLGRQRATVAQLLPLAQSPKTESAPGAGAMADGGRGAVGASGGPAATGVTYDFSPEPAELLKELLPATVRIRLFQFFLEAAACEHIFRMVAMKAATDAAGDMIKQLTREYNRARQTLITMELLDIVGGANALA